MNVPWYLSRSAGLIAYLTLFLTVVLGISIRTRRLDRLLARWRVTDLHTFLSLLSLAFVALHAGALLWDGFVGYSLFDILVPFATGYRTFWTGIGIVSLYLLAAVALSFPARRLTGYKAWRSLHYSTFVIYVIALGHGIFTGTDSRTAWAQLIYISTAAVVLALVLYRIYTWRTQQLARLQETINAGRLLRASAGAVAAARAAVERLHGVEDRATVFGFAAMAVGAVLIFAAGLGPFRWFERGGSDDDGGSAFAAQPVEPTATLGLPAGNTAAGFSDAFSGTATQRQSGSTIVVTLHGSATGDRPVTLDVQLQLQQTGRGTSASSNTLQLLSADGSELCSGEVDSLTSQGLAGSCVGEGAFAGHRLTLELHFANGFESSITGTLSATLSA